MAGDRNGETVRTASEASALLQDQAIFKKLFESLPDGVVEANARGEIVRVNAQAEKMLGYQRGELARQPINLLVPERYREAHTSHTQHYAGEPHTRPMGAGLELYARRKDGSEFPVGIMLSPVEAPDGVHVLAVIRDSTARKQAEDALRKSEAELRSIIESVEDYAIFLLDPEGRVISWSPGAERIKGYGAGEILGQHFSRFYLPEDAERGKPEHELRVAAEQGRVEDEGWRLRKDGSRFWANAVMTAVRDQSGRLRGFTKVTRDFTQRKQGEEALLLQVTNTLISSLDIRRLFSAISASLRQVAPHEFAALAIYDPAVDKLRLHVLDAPSRLNLPGGEHALPLKDSLFGQAFTSREPIVVGRPEGFERFTCEFTSRCVQAGMKAGCWLPLVSRSRTVGTLMVGRESEKAFSEADVHILAHVAGQVALALDNAEAFRQVSELKDRLAEEKAYLEEELRTEYNFEEIVGESPALRRTLKQVEAVAPTDATALVLGETGTGKELIARAIHNLSARRGRTFVRLNCAAIPGGLLESELFGHEKGAFTGAISQKIGRLELAHQGTLFLDEVGDIPLELQPKLLRALQEKEFERLGSTRTIPVDVRLIAATNRDLAQMVKERQFRSDLYYRLRVFPILVAPLRERTGDIPVLVHHFVQKHARRMSKRIEVIPPETMRALERWPWPGNVRELENFIERAVILSSGRVLQAPLAELAVAAESAERSNEPGTLEAAEREHILRVLRETSGVIAGPNGAAARLGLKRTTLNSKMRRLGIHRQHYSDRISSGDEM